MQPKISSIIPIYNSEKYLSQALNSIINQTLEDIEIICVDDGSTDNSLEILYDFKTKDNRLIILTQENKGAGITRNNGIEHANGEYLHFLDSDDYLEIDAYEKMYNAAKINDADLLKAKAYAIDEDTTRIVPNPRYNLSNIAQEDFNKVTNFYEIPEKFMQIAVVPWNGIYKRSFILENNIRFNDLICVNDRSFYNSVIIYARKVIILDGYFLYHRTNVKTSLVGRRGVHFDCHFKSYQLIKKQCEWLSDDLQEIILNAELSDLFTWYRVFRNDPVIGDQISLQTKEFLQDLDLPNFTGKNYRNWWFKDYKKLILDKNDAAAKNECSSDCQEVETISWMPQIIRNGIRCYQENGLSYTIWRIKEKALGR